MRASAPRHAFATPRLTKADLPTVKVSALRAAGLVNPTMDCVILAIGELERTIKLSHRTMRRGGGWSYFYCPQCDGRTPVLRLTEANALACWRCDGLPYATKQRKHRLSRIQTLRARLEAGSNVRARTEAALRRLLIRERRERLERIARWRKAMRARSSAS